MYDIVFSKVYTVYTAVCKGSKKLLEIVGYWFWGFLSNKLCTVFCNVKFISDCTVQGAVKVFGFFPPPPSYVINCNHYGGPPHCNLM